MNTNGQYNSAGWSDVSLPLTCAHSLEYNDAKFEVLYADHETLTSLVNAIRRNEENRGRFTLRKSGSPSE